MSSAFLTRAARPGRQIPPHPLGERLAFDQFENQRWRVEPERRSWQGLRSVDCGDVRMVERGEHARFALESLQAIRIIGNAGGRSLMATSRPSLLSRAR